MASVFTKIINGELPSYKVHEDELTISILALDQVNPGHVLVIPKQEVNHWFEVPSETYARIGGNAQMIAKALIKVTQAPRIGTMVAGFEVPHFHLHLIPAWSIPDLDFKRAKKLSDVEMKSLQLKIIDALN